MSLLKYFVAPEQPLVKVVGPSADGKSTLIHVLPTPFGSPKKKDLHGEYFTPNTYFGDDVVQVKFGLYEHLMNDYSNPVMAEMGVQKQILGAARLLTEEQKKDANLDTAERWFEMEVKRSLEYHDMLMNMIDAKMMGASTQSFMNGKRRKADGEIEMWLENEISVTPTPANFETIGKVAGIAKAYTVKSATPVLPKLMLVKNGQLLEVDLEKPEAVLEEEAPVPTTEDTLASSEVDKDLVAQLHELLDEGEQPKSTQVDTKAIQQYIANEVEKAIAPLKASMSVFIELWGATPDEAREAIMQMMGQQKSTAEALPRLEKNLKGIEEGFLVLANHMKSQKADQIKKQVSPRELDVLEDRNLKQTRRIPSGVPEHIRADAK